MSDDDFPEYVPRRRRKVYWVSDRIAELEAEVERLRAELDATRERETQARAEEREAIIDLVGRQFGEDLGWGTAQNLVDRICARGDTTGGE